MGPVSVGKPFVKGIHTLALTINVSETCPIPGIITIICVGSTGPACFRCSGYELSVLVSGIDSSKVLASSHAMRVGLGPGEATSIVLVGVPGVDHGSRGDECEGEGSHIEILYT